MKDPICLDAQVVLLKGFNYLRKLLFLASHVAE
jgi:hypothetical protein